MQARRHFVCMCRLWSTALFLARNEKVWVPVCRTNDRARWGGLGWGLTDGMCCNSGCIKFLGADLKKKKRAGYLDKSSITLENALNYRITALFSYREITRPAIYQIRPTSLMFFIQAFQKISLHFSKATVGRRIHGEGACYFVEKFSTF